MKTAAIITVLAIATMLLLGTASVEELESGIVIDREEQTSAEASPDQGEEFRVTCCVDDVTGICHWSTAPGSCPPGTSEISCPCPWTSEKP